MASAPALFHDVEQRFLKLSEALEAATAERDELRTAAAEHESGLAKLTLSLTSAQRGAADAEERRAAAERDAARLDGARRANAERADRAELRAAELAAASADAQRALADARKEARENTEKCARAESQARASTLERERWAREREALEGHAAWLKDELDQRSQELRDSRGEASRALAAAERARDEARGDAASKAHLLEASEERRAAAERAQTAAEARLRDARGAAARDRAALEADLVAEKRLSVALVDEGDAHERDARKHAERAAAAAEREAAAARRLEEQVAAVKRECDDLLAEAREAALLGAVVEAAVAAECRAAAAAELAAAAAAAREAEAAAAARAVRDAAEARALAGACLRHLAGLLGSGSTSLLAHRAATLRATKIAVARLDGARVHTPGMHERLDHPSGAPHTLPLLDRTARDDEAAAGGRQPRPLRRIVRREPRVLGRAELVPSGGPSAFVHHHATTSALASADEGRHLRYAAPPPPHARATWR